MAFCGNSLAVTFGAVRLVIGVEVRTVCSISDTEEGDIGPLGGGRRRLTLVPTTGVGGDGPVSNFCWQFMKLLKKVGIWLHPTTPQLKHN